MKRIYLFVLLSFHQIFFGQEFQNNFQRAEELPVKNSDIKNIIKIQDAVYLTSYGETNLMAIREFQFDNGILQRVKTFDSNQVLTSDEQYFYDEKNDLIRITEFIALDFVDKKNSDIKVTTKRNKNNQIVEIKFEDVRDNNTCRMKKFSSYSNDDKDFILEETSIIDSGESINDFDATYKMKFTYQNGNKTLYQNLKNNKEITYKYDADGILISKEGKEFIDAKDSNGNVIKRIFKSKIMTLSNFYKITYADGTISGDLKFDTAFFKGK